jgi:uncharacterized protein
MQAFTIKFIPTEQGGRLSALCDGKELGHLDFNTLAADSIDAHHTYVTPEARSDGVAAALLDALAEHVQSKHLHLHASCSYVAKMMPRRYPQITLE